jgi:SAM-dependent methyltransferase
VSNFPAAFPFLSSVAVGSAGWVWMGWREEPLDEANLHLYPLPMGSPQATMDIREALTVTPEWYGMITWDAHTQAYGHGVWRAMQKDFVTRIDVPLGSKVLDVGTGTGGTAIEAARVVGPSGHVTGIDNATALVEIARDETRRSDIGNVLFEVMDLGDLRFPDSSFDCVLSHFALNGSFPPGVGAREAYRVLRRAAS